MKRIKIFIFATILFFYGCKSTDKTKMDEVLTLRVKVDSLNKEIYELYEQIDVMRDELQFKESEISYWGHKYDSIVEVVKKK